MTYLIATIPLEEILQNPEHIPSPLIIQRFNRKPVMLSVLPQEVHYIYMGYGSPVYAYVMKDSWFRKHLPHLSESDGDDAGVLNELPSLMMDYEANKVRIQQIYPMQRWSALPQKLLHDKIQQFGKTHNFNAADYYGFVLEDFDIREI